MIRRINSTLQLQELAVELGVRFDWHEPDEQEVCARVFGSSFDNAGFWGEGTDDRPHAEMWVRLYQHDEPVADVNLATLFAMACGELR